jgi:threonylcarbamoyladenosine tRNA methylthiotransferase MtaB
VQDGCDYHCSFCTIPRARGKSRSARIAAVEKQVNAIAALGVREIVLTGVNLGDFGANAFPGEPEEDFYALLRILDDRAEIPRLRISSTEPNLLSREIIDLVAGSRRIMPHFHLPLQSGSNRILAKMKRRYRRELYAERVHWIKTQIPHCAIGADVIVGFPGETEEDFRDTAEFLESLDISYLHVFTYSERDHTDALALRPVVPFPVRHERNKALRMLSHDKMERFRAEQAGTLRPVLFEVSDRGGTMEGYTDNYIRVTRPYNPTQINHIVDCRL